jgi:hypothetical protein
MPLDPGTLIHRWFDEVWNRGREDTVDELFAPDGIAHGLGEGASDVRRDRYYQSRRQSDCGGL